MLPQQQGGYAPQQGGYPPQQGGYPPQQGGYPPQQGGYPPAAAPQHHHHATPSKALSGFERLVNKEGIYIKQKVDIAEAVSGCERANSYFIHAIDKQAEKTGVEILRAKETSSFCARQCLAGSCRPFLLTVQLRDTDETAHNQPFLEIVRPCTCTFFCFYRPKVEVYHVEGGKRTLLGKIVEPWRCCCQCDLKLEVFNQSNNLAYRISAKCCQSGLMCGSLPCTPCQTVDFTVESAAGMVLSSIQKRTAGYYASMSTLSDNFAVSFPANCSTEDKCMVMASALFIDYMYFERRVGLNKCE